MKDKPKVAKLVGEKCMLQCRLNDIMMPVLMDTGAQVSIIEKRVLEERFPDNKIKPVEDLLDDGDNLRVQWGNSHGIPFRGFLELSVTLGEDQSLQKLNVPFLVTTERLNQTILGFNAIKMLVQLNGNLELLHEMIYQSVGNELQDNVSAFVDLIQGTKEQENFTVKVKGKDIVISADKLLQVHCKADVGYIDQVRPMMFNSSSEQTLEGLQCADTVVYLRKGINNYFKIVLVNNSNHDIFLRKNTVLGPLNYVSSVIPLEVKNIEIPSNKVPEKDAVFTNNITSNLEQPQKLSEEQQQAVVNKTDISGLTHEHREKARKLLRDESHVFFVSDDDIGDVNTHSMKINLQDSVPVQQTYHSVPKHLYRELKNYIEDLLNKQWIVHSNSAYSSLVVAVRKKDGTLRLCCD